MLLTHDNLLMLSKIMTRNTFAKPDAKLSSKTKIAHSKADVLNLMSNDLADVSEIGRHLLGMLSTLIEVIVGCAYIYQLMGKFVFAVFFFWAFPDLDL
jgi:hypothetical protein